MLVINYIMNNSIALAFVLKHILALEITFDNINYPSSRLERKRRNGSFCKTIDACQ